LATIQEHLRELIDRRVYTPSAREFLFGATDLAFGVLILGLGFFMLMWVIATGCTPEVSAGSSAALGRAQSSLRALSCRCRTGQRPPRQSEFRSRSPRRLLRTDSQSSSIRAVRFRDPIRRAAAADPSHAAFPEAPSARHCRPTRPARG